MEDSQNELDHRTSLSINLAPDNRQPGRWAELRIPSSWMEGGTRTYERTGAASPRSEGNLYTLEITYLLGGRQQLHCALLIPKMPFTDRRVRNS